ncbi:MAG: DUF3809 domain-containing protein [Trueperaceae bacterium]|nr:DUF3809 domain-containing protein [Trueperaceae bacterium]
MKLSHSVSFTFDLILPYAEAVQFVRDAKASLKNASFIDDLQVQDNLVSASIPVNAALFGQQLLAFKSRLEPSPSGARLIALELDTDQPGWAEVAGEAKVEHKPKGSQVSYTFDITIHLRLPKAEKWGGKALRKMIEFTAQKVLENVTSQFPCAVQEAAKEAEASYAA